MTRSECFRILGLPENSSEVLVRKQYKKLAMRLHPDVNPDPRAHESFIKLGQAVECILSGNFSEIEVTRKSRRTNGSESEDELNERLKQAKERFEFRKRQEAMEEERYFQSLITGKKWRFFKLSAICSICFACFFLLEVFLPKHFEKDQLVSINQYQYSGWEYADLMQVQLKNHGTCYINFNPGIFRNKYPEAVILSSWFFHSPIEMYTNDDYMIYGSQFDFKLYNFRAVLIPLFLMPLIPLFFKRRTISFVILYQISYWGISGLLFILLLTEYRLLHLLTLGFY